MNKKILIGTLVLLSGLMSKQLFAKDYKLTFPDQRIVITISVDEHVRFSIQDSAGFLVEQLSPGMTIGELSLGNNPRVLSEKYTSIDQLLYPIVPTISSEVRDHCKQLTLKFKGDFSLVFRAYNNGVAYRFETTLPGDVYVQNERMDLSIGSNFTTWFPREESMLSHYERNYEVQNAGEIASGEFCSLPVLFKSPWGSSVLFTEADLYDYPCMFLQKGDQDSFGSLFPPVVLETLPMKGSEDRSQVITSEADYMAVTIGTRIWPWRLFMIAQEDGDLLTNNLVFQLSRPLQLEQTDWIKPGLVAWDWWNMLNVYGVDFESGINNETYKYYIDFASEFTACFSRPMSMGTRCHQLAMYVIYLSPIQMLCDVPSNYYRERVCTQFISDMPTTWDETRVLEAGVSDHIVMARRSGENWYIGGMTAGTEQEFELDLSFLTGTKYQAEIMEDGVNADKMAQDYNRKVIMISKGDKLRIHMVKGGGWAAILRPEP